MPPTREEWKALVAKHGYNRAVTMIDCDLDDIPGIEDTWIENLHRHADDMERGEIEFLEKIRALKS